MSLNGITDPAYSIECGIQELKYALIKQDVPGPTDLDRIKLALQGYNYGSGYIDGQWNVTAVIPKKNAIALFGYDAPVRTGIMPGMGTRNMWSMFPPVLSDYQYRAEAIRQTECRFRTISRPITGTFLMAAAVHRIFRSVGLPALP